MALPRNRAAPSPFRTRNVSHESTAGHSTRIGRAAERLVADHLVERGWILLGVNVRVGRDELDVVALDGRTLVVVEVRTRRNDSYGHAFETVNRAKITKLRRAAMRYMAERGADEIRIDVASVTKGKIEIIENAIDFTST